MTQLNTFAKAWQLLDKRERRNALLVLLVIIIAALSSALMVASVLPFLAVLSDPTRVETNDALKWAFDSFGFSSNYTFLVALGAVSLATILTVNVIQIIKVYLLSRFTQMRMHSISHHLFTLYMSQNYEFYLSKHSGLISKKILAESGAVVQKFLMPTAELIASSATIISILGLLIWIDYRVSVSALFVFGSIYVAAFSLTRAKLRKMGKKRVLYNGRRFRYANEALGGIKEVKMLSREASYLQLYQKPSWMMSKTMASVAILSGLPQFIVQIIAFGGIILICLILMDPVAFDAGAGNLGEILPLLGVFAFAGQRLMPELGRFYQALAQIQYGGPAVLSVAEDFDSLEAEVSFPSSPPPPLGLERTLSLQNVTYRYPNSDTGGVIDVSVQIHKGERVGVVGATGAGKTTIADIILGLLLPSKGQLVADDIPITTSNIRAWQQTVGYVPQSIFLVDSTVSQNIALGTPPEEIDEDRVRRAAQHAQIHEFIIEDLPHGYQTTVGERGVRLSGGQRQRIGIARALYHNADLIVFDEATSALDNKTERELMEAIESLDDDKTIIMIAHRLSSLRACDRILVLDRGHLVASGPWDLLAEESAHFRALLASTDQLSPEEARLS